MTNIPDPNQSTPSTRPDLTNVVFLKSEITTDLIEVGDYTYPFTMFGGTWAENTMETFTGIDQPGDTVIGHDVWLGRNATVMPGVTVGDGAVIGAHSVVTGDVGPYKIVAGNPARVIRKRFSDEEIALLLATAWWEWPVDLITEHAAAIMGGSPSDLASVADTLRD